MFCRFLRLDFRSLTFHLKGAENKTLVVYSGTYSTRLYTVCRGMCTLGGGGKSNLLLDKHCADKGAYHTARTRTLCGGESPARKMPCNATSMAAELGNVTPT